MAFLSNDSGRAIRVRNFRIVGNVGKIVVASGRNILDGGIDLRSPGMK